MVRRWHTRSAPGWLRVERRPPLRADRPTYAATDEQILAIVREGEAGRKVADLVRAHGTTEPTLCFAKTSQPSSTRGR